MQGWGHSTTEKGIEGTLDCWYEGPYTILRRSGENVKLSLPDKDKWVHLNRCKPYEKSKLATRASSQVEDMGSESGGIDTKYEDPGPASEKESGSTPGQSLELEPYRDLQQEELSDEDINPGRRYPRRSRKPPERYDGYFLQ